MSRSALGLREPVPACPCSSQRWWRDGLLQIESSSCSSPRDPENPLDSHPGQGPCRYPGGSSLTRCHATAHLNNFGRYPPRFPWVLYRRVFFPFPSTLHDAVLSCAVPATRCSLTHTAGRPTWDWGSSTIPSEKIGDAAPSFAVPGSCQDLTSGPGPLTGRTGRKRGTESGRMTSCTAPLGSDQRDRPS